MKRPGGEKQENMNFNLGRDRSFSNSSILRRRWIRIIPVAFVMYTIAYVDRTNISLCLPTMARALGRNPVEAGSVAGVFFWGYLWLQIPAGYLARVWSPKRIVSILMVAWGCCAVAMGLVSTWDEAWVLRLLLGLAEGGVFPATLVLLSNWFEPAERARANGYWMLCQPCAVIFASPLSGYILGRWGWQTVFVVEGCMPFLWFVIWSLRIDDSPGTARWISAEEQKELAQAPLREPAESVTEPGRSTLRVLLGRQALILVVIAVFVNCAGYGFLFWLPSALLRARTLSPFFLGVLFTAPYVIGACAMVLNSKDSDRSGDRRMHVAVPLALSGVCLLGAVLVGERSFWWYVLLLSIAGAGTYATLGPFWAIPSETMPARAAGSGIGLINSVGNLGGYFGPLLVGVLNRHSENFRFAFVALSIFLVAGAALAFALKQHPIVAEL